jgi:phenylacetate-CoA ligase
MTAAQDFQHQYFDMLMQSQHWPEQMMAEYQRGQLEQLLRHARATVPFYEDRLKPVVKRDGSVDLDRWTEIPILKRSELSRFGNALMSREPVAGHGPWGEISTSGSTGDPVALRITRLMDLVTRVCRWRADGWEGLDWSKTLLARLPDDPRRPDGFSLGPWGPSWDERARSGRTVHVNRSTSMEVLLRRMDELRPAYFANGPKIMQVLAELAERKGIKFEIEAILAFGEAVGSADREAAMQGFGARIIELYSSKEAGAIAHQCPDRVGLHVDAEGVLVEILNDDDGPAEIGQMGRVIVTPFSSTAQPLIRYDQGDLAVRGRPCRCGRTLPVLDTITGRTTAIFRHPDGRRSARMLHSDLRMLIGAGQWQVAQVGANAYEVRYVPRDWGRSYDEPAFIDGFRKTYFEDATRRLVPIAEIPLTPAGKFIEYINEWNVGV